MVLVRAASLKAQIPSTPRCIDRGLTGRTESCALPPDSVEAHGLVPEYPRAPGLELSTLIDPSRQQRRAGLATEALLLQPESWLPEPVLRLVHVLFCRFSRPVCPCCARNDSGYRAVTLGWHPARKDAFALAGARCAAGIALGTKHCFMGIPPWGPSHLSTPSGEGRTTSEPCHHGPTWGVPGVDRAL